MFSVVADRACPSLPATTETGTPAVSICLAVRRTRWRSSRVAGRCLSDIECAGRAVPEHPARRLLAGGCGPVGDITESYNHEVGPGTAFIAELAIVDGNPFVSVPSPVLSDLFAEAGRSKSPIPVRGTINGRPFQQTLVRFRGAWRLYVNMTMLDDSPRRIGELIEVAVSFDPSDRAIEPHPKLLAMLEANRDARNVFDALAPSRQMEIVRYIDGLKSEESVDRNVRRARDFLLGNGRFVGRDRP